MLQWLLAESRSLLSMDNDFALYLSHFQFPVISLYRKIKVRWLIFDSVKKNQIVSILMKHRKHFKACYINIYWQNKWKETHIRYFLPLLERRILGLMLCAVCVMPSRAIYSSISERYTVRMHSTIIIDINITFAYLEAMQVQSLNVASEVFGKKEIAHRCLLSSVLQILFSKIQSLI